MAQVISGKSGNGFVSLIMAAIQFLTRLPVPSSLVTAETDIGRAAAFFPLVGFIVGGGAALVYVLTARILPASTAALAAIIFSAAITNGFHEDGLADSFDGFGGGWTREDALAIMRDSRIGTYGSLGLIFLILAKYNLLSNLTGPGIWRWLIVAHVASRWTTLPLAVWLPYARPEGRGGLVARRIPSHAVVIASLTLAAAGLLLPWRVGLIGLAVTVAVVLLSGLYYRHRLGGITGDCLGATNQLTEVALYLTALLVSRYS